MKTKSYYIIEHKGHTINIIRDALLLGPMPVLWCNGGMYAIIPGTILEEMFENKNGDATGAIWWEQCYELEPDVGRLLCDSAYNGE
ncbi:hypothetical protein LCGC14_0423150 [marine sediment metagenome]|uniref:Uncharacterized protein n=1 Tax=marine sediment metagenome TaxID=412755 RepID=A0A0F9T8I9_9ZZZZ